MLLNHWISQVGHTQTHIPIASYLVACCSCIHVQIQWSLNVIAKQTWLQCSFSLLHWPASHCPAHSFTCQETIEILALVRTSFLSFIILYSKRLLYHQTHASINYSNRTDILLIILIVSQKI